MNYTIEVRESYIYVNVSGQVSLKSRSGWGEISSALEDVVNTAKNNNVFKVLVDGRGISGKFTTMDRFLVAVFFVKENSRLFAGRLRPMKISFLADKSIIDPKKFGETVARNRGLRGLVTDNMQEALQWLEQDVPSAKKS
jgi:hypothetical protein